MMTNQKSQTNPPPSKQHLQLAVHQAQAGNKMDARSKWLSRQDHMDQNSKGRKLCGVAVSQQKNINKYYPETDETPTGHMNQQRKNVQSTKKTFEECNAMATLQGKKVKDIYIRIYDTGKTSFSLPNRPIPQAI